MKIITIIVMCIIIRIIIHHHPSFTHQPPPLTETARVLQTFGPFVAFKKLQQPQFHGRGEGL